MPIEKTLRGEWLLVGARRIQHYLDDSIHRPVRRYQPANIHAKAPGEGGPHLLCVEFLALDFARLQYIDGQSLEDCTLLERKAQSLHPPE
jgi:hypothetical protein